MRRVKHNPLKTLAKIAEIVHNRRMSTYTIYPLALFLCIVLGSSAFADSSKKEESTTNIESYKDSLHLRPFFLFPSLELKIQDTKSSNDTHKLTYKPNTMINIGADVSWKGWGLSYSVGILPIPGMDADKYGKTDYLDFQFYYYFGKFNIDVFYQNYTGYYLADNDGKSINVRSDVQAMNTGINLMYVFSDSYSFRSSFTQTERQIKSGGSFILMMSCNYFSINSSHSLIPPDNESLYGKSSGYRRGYYPSVIFSAGYSYTQILHDRWYLTLSLLVGGGWMYQMYDVSAGNIKEHSLCSKYNNRLAFGYNGESYFFGLLSVIDLHSTEPFLGLYGSKTAGIVITRMSVYGMIFGGTRF